MNIIKQIIMLNTLYHTIPIVLSTAHLVYDITSTVVIWSFPKIDYCKCNVCDDYRKRFGIEPRPH